MNKISKVFNRTKPFIGYITAGDGGFNYTIDCALALVKGGVDILEIGFPFSDPVADGLVIQRAHERALLEGTNSTMILEIAKNLRKSLDIPLVLFSYYNPILQLGPNYLHQLKLSGFDAVLIVDLAVPLEPDRKEPFFEKVVEANLIPILLATPSTNQDRLLRICKIARGFLYYVSQKGTTGVRKKLADDFSEKMTFLRQSCNIPIVSGFGIADRSTAKASLEYADGFVVGSAFVKKMEEKVDPLELLKLAKVIDPRNI